MDLREELADAAAAEGIRDLVGATKQGVEEQVSPRKGISGETNIELNKIV